MQNKPKSFIILHEITSAKVSEISVVGDWIYYINVSDNRTIYKMQLDGRDKRQIFNKTSQYLTVVEDMIYFKAQDWGSIYHDDDNIEEGEMYFLFSMKNNGVGSKSIDLTKHREFYSVNHSNNKLYLGHNTAIYDISINDDNVGVPVSINGVFINFNVSHIFNVIDDNFYVINEDKNQSLYVVKYDAGEGIEVSNHPQNSINLVKIGDSIYFLDWYDGKPHKIEI